MIVHERTVQTWYKFKDDKLLLMHGLEEIIQVSEFKYLGVIIDETLSFAPHINKLKSKVNQRTGLMWCIRHSIPLEPAKDLYCSLIEPYFIYCSFIYDACNLELKRQLQVCQNEALKAVLTTHNRHPSNLLHEETGISWLGTSQAIASCIEIHKFIHDSSHNKVCDKAQVAIPVRILKSNNKLKIDIRPPKTKLVERNLLFRGIKYWTNLMQTSNNRRAWQYLNVS